MPAQSPVRGRMALIAASLAGLLLLFVLGTVFSTGPVIEAGGNRPGRTGGNIRIHDQQRLSLSGR